MLRASVLCLSLLCLGGCRSAFIEVTIANKSPRAVTLIEVDYPSASFGVGTLAPGGEFHYRFKLQGSGELKMEFTDAAGKPHSATGPVVHEGQDGKLTIAIDPADRVQWTF
jgi:hypothetical protein